MSKSSHQRQNQQDESRLLDRDAIEQRALQIARSEGRDEIQADDRERARAELLAPEDPGSESEFPPDADTAITAWDEAPASSGTRVPRIPPDDEASIGKELSEHGLRQPNRTRNGGDPLEREDEGQP